MKIGDHNPKRNLTVLKAFVEELQKRELEVVQVSLLAEVIARLEDRHGNR